VFAVLILAVALAVIAVSVMAISHRRPISELDLQLARMDAAFDARPALPTTAPSLPQPRQAQSSTLVKTA
jgi:hypothetical protein